MAAPIRAGRAYSPYFSVFFRIPPIFFRIFLTGSPCPAFFAGAGSKNKAARAGFYLKSACRLAAKRYVSTRNERFYCRTDLVLLTNIALQKRE
ncbi:MAG: hypothetical protein V4488_09190 [Pseudomonadota bacterium]